MSGREANYGLQPLGAGIGLRAQHYSDLLAPAHQGHASRSIPWLEVLADNYLAQGGAALHNLEAIRRAYPVTFHCVGMSLGSTDPLDMGYLGRLRELADRFEPHWISDHLAWCLLN